MDDIPGTDPRTTTSPTGSVRKKSGKGPLWAFLAVVAAFLIGFGWQWYEASTVREQLTVAQQELLIERLRVRLGQAALAAQTGDYESARQQMSEFFTHVAEAEPSLPDSVATVTDGFLAMRDEVITGLSRANPEYAGVLYGMLERFRDVSASTMTTPAAPARPETTAAPPDTTGGPGQ